MIFHSLDFVVFFLVTVTIYWVLPHRWQNLLLLVSSYVFYGWVHPWFLALIFATTCIDYGSTRGMSRWPHRKRALLWLSVVTNFGLLGYFKYVNFFVENVAAALGALGWHVPHAVLNVALPVGISFYTFQSMSYTIDVYKGHARARTSLLDVATFVSFFPHLVAGPIMRATNLLPQVETQRRFSASAARDATLLMAWGFFKKLVIADNVGVIANKVFALEAPEFYMLWAGVFAFSIQIYADFSAYTDIARGTAKWFGFDLIKNFDHPYLAKGPSDFWRRWNISLSTWFRDYVFLPIAYKMSGAIKADRALGLDAITWAYVIGMIVTMLTAGLWHGASWNYVLWGAYHGVLLAVARIAGAFPKPRKRIRRWLAPLQIAGMFLLTSLGWLFFRETEFAALVRDLQLSPSQATVLGTQTAVYLFGLAAIYSAPLWIHSLWVAAGGPDLVGAMLQEETRPHLGRVAAQAGLAGLLFAGVLVLRSLTTLDFIYFQF